MGPLNHFWYLQLDRLVLGNGMTAVLKKIICDQLMFAPTCITVFYLGKLFTSLFNFSNYNYVHLTSYHLVVVPRNEFP